MSTIRTTGIGIQRKCPMLRTTTAIGTRSRKSVISHTTGDTMIMAVTVEIKAKWRWGRCAARAASRTIITVMSRSDVSSTPARDRGTGPEGGCEGNLSSWIEQLVPETGDREVIAKALENTQARQDDAYVIPICICS